MKKERRIYTKATDKLKKLFGNESAVYFSNVGQDDETGVINSHGLSLEDADEVGQFEFLYLVGRLDAFMDESVVGFRFDGDYYHNIGWAPGMEEYVGVTGIILEYYRYNGSLNVVFGGDVHLLYPAEIVAKQLDKNTVKKPKHYSKGIDTFARMEANSTKEGCLAFIQGNIDKYNWREKGQDLEDFDKIIAYAEWGKSILNKI